MPQNNQGANHNPNARELTPQERLEKLQRDAEALKRRLDARS